MGWLERGSSQLERTARTPGGCQRLDVGIHEMRGGKPAKVLGPARELQRRRRVRLALGQPASHFAGVMQLVRDGAGAVAVVATATGDRLGIAGVRLVDEPDGCDVVCSEGLEGLHVLLSCAGG